MTNKEKYDLIASLDDCNSHLMLGEPDLEQVLKQLEDTVRQLEGFIYGSNEVQL